MSAVAEPGDATGAVGAMTAGRVVEVDELEVVDVVAIGTLLDGFTEPDATVVTVVGFSSALAIVDGTPLAVVVVGEG